MPPAGLSKLRPQIQSSMAHIPRDTELQERWGHLIAHGQKHTRNRHWKNLATY